MTPAVNMSNHLRNIRALLESAKDFKVSRKVDTYEYESLEKMILGDQIRYSEVIELFTDAVYREWFYDRNFGDKKGMVITRFSTE